MCKSEGCINTARLGSSLYMPLLLVAHLMQDKRSFMMLSILHWTYDVPSLITVINRTYTFFFEIMSSERFCVGNSEKSWEGKIVANFKAKVVYYSLQLNPAVLVTSHSPVYVLCAVRW